MKPRPTLVELTALFRDLAATISAMSAEPTKDDAHYFLQQGQTLGQLAHEALVPTPLSATEAEVDALHAAIAEAHILLQSRFAEFLPPRIA